MAPFVKRETVEILRMDKMSKRIDSSENYRFFQISAPANRHGYLIINKFDEGITQKRHLGSLRIGMHDALPLLVSTLFAAGFDTKEILAEIYSQSFDIDRETVEALMRK